MRAVQITEFGGPEVLDVVDLPDPVPGEGQELFDVSAAGINYADTPPRAVAQLTSRRRASPTAAKVFFDGPATRRPSRPL